MSNPRETIKPPKKRPIRTEISFLLSDCQGPEKRARVNPPVSAGPASSYFASSSTLPENGQETSTSTTQPDDPPLGTPLQQPFETNVCSSSRSVTTRRHESLDNEFSDIDEIEAIPPAAPAQPLRPVNTQCISQPAPRLVANQVPCNECGNRFCNEAAVQRHKRSKHATGERVKPVECRECHLVLKNQQNLIRHNRNHGPGARFACADCNARFTTRRSRTVHMRDFHGRRTAPRFLVGVSILCPAGCGYASNQKTNVTRHHNNVHLGIRIFVCPVCGHRASTRGNLQVHMNTHKTKGKTNGKRTMRREGIKRDETDRKNGCETDREGTDEYLKGGDETDKERGDGTDSEDGNMVPNLVLV